MPIADSGGVRIYYEERGAGPALLLVPGIPAIFSDWFPFAEPLAEQFHVIAYDNRGSGRSGAPPGPYTTAQMAADAVAVLDAVDVQRAHLFGASLGGMIAQELALGFPHRVDRLVLGCTHAGFIHLERPSREVDRAFARQTADWAERMRQLAQHAFAPDVDPKILDAFIAKKVGDEQPEHGYRAQIAAVLTHDALDRLRNLQTETLILTGEADAIIPAANSHVLREAIPDAELEVIPATGHLFFLEAPEHVRELLVEFLLTPGASGADQITAAGRR